MYKVLVTGGTRGIGLAIAERLRKAGYQVIPCARDEGAAVRCDVTSRSQVERMRDQIGSIDVLINNVGGAVSAPFLETTEEIWDLQFERNVKTAFTCARVFLPGMLERNLGRIINIASTAGMAGYKFVSAYVAAKHAVVGFTRALALEYADRGITVNAVCPSFVDTPMLRESLIASSQKTGKSVEQLLDSLRRRSPQKRLATPEEVAAAVQLLIETPAINGQCITLDGGETV